MVNILASLEINTAQPQQESSPGLSVVFYLCIFAMALSLALVAFKALRRRNSLERFAKDNGLKYWSGGSIARLRLTPDENKTTLEVLSTWRQFNNGAVSNVVSGIHNDEWLAIFDARWITGTPPQGGKYSTGLGKFSSFHPKLSVGVYSTFAATKLETHAPPTLIATGTIFPWLYDGMVEVTLESEDFNHRYKVFSQDPRFATALVSPQMMEVLIGTSAPPMTIQFVNQTALFNSTRRLKPALWPAVLDFVESVRATTPRVVSELYPPE